MEMSANHNGGLLDPSSQATATLRAESLSKETLFAGLSDPTARRETRNIPRYADEPLFARY